MFSKSTLKKKDPKSFKDLQIIMKRLPTTQKSRIRQNVTSMRFFSLIFLAPKTTNLYKCNNNTCRLVEQLEVASKGQEL